MSLRQVPPLSAGAVAFQAVLKAGGIDLSGAAADGHVSIAPIQFMAHQIFRENDVVIDENERVHPCPRQRYRHFRPKFQTFE